MDKKKIKEEHLRLIKEKHISWNKESHKKLYTHELKDLVLKLLDRNPETRLGSKGDSEEILGHSVFTKEMIDKVNTR
jgi:hypothetical protein